MRCRASRFANWLRIDPSGLRQTACRGVPWSKRYLKEDGTVWLNLGDTYHNYRADGLNVKQTLHKDKHDQPEVSPNRANKIQGLKEKDLMGIPWRVAFALQEDGWYLRQDIIWHKPNPMPESVKDRCTKAHEYIFLSARTHITTLTMRLYKKRLVKTDGVARHLST